MDEHQNLKKETDFINQIEIDIKNSERVSIYLHYPLCETPLCKFCHYIKLSANKKNKLIMELLAQEIDKFIEKVPSINGKEISSLYIGGGTPSLMNENDIKSIFYVLKGLNISMDCEKTI